MKLSELETGRSGKIVKIDSSGAVKRRLLDMGLLTGQVVRVERVAPLGDPVELSVRNFRLSLRRSELETIDVEEVISC